MKRFKFLFLFLCLFMPLAFVGCENEVMGSLSTPTNLVINEGVISFSIVDNAEYYVISINDNEIVVNPNASQGMGKVTRVDNILYYNANDILFEGESYSIKVKATANERKDSNFTSTSSYVHASSITKPILHCSNTELTWTVADNASYYLVKIVTPEDNLIADDSNSITDAEVATYQFRTNRFDFSSILSTPGKYKFYVNAVKLGSNGTSSYYVESGYTNAYEYVYKKQLNAPNYINIYQVEDHLHMVAVIDENSRAIVINHNGLETSIELNGSNAGIRLEKLNENDISNYLDIDLNVALNKTFDITKQHTFSIRTIQTNVDSEKYYLNSTSSKEVFYNGLHTLQAPVLTLTNDISNKKVVSWADTNALVGGYNVYIATNDGVEIHKVDADVKSMTIDKEFISVSVQAIGVGNYLSSNLSEQIGYITGDNVVENLEIAAVGGEITWTSAEDCDYIVEIGNQIFVTSSNSLDISALKIDNSNLKVRVTLISDDKPAQTETKLFTYNKKLLTVSNLGFKTGDLYTLTFDTIDNAIGYYVYLNGNPINKLFTSNVIDLSNYITKANENEDSDVVITYEVAVVAVADKYSIYTNSNISSSVSVTKERVLAKPTDVSVSIIGGKYYLNFKAVDNAENYEILINSINVTLNPYSYNGETKIFTKEITKYLKGAGYYLIQVRALPAGSAVGFKASPYTEITYELKEQLKTVENVQVNELDNVYTLSFDLQDNVETYSVRVVKVGDKDYNVTFNTPGPKDVTEYVEAAGEYHFYITALAKEGSLYGDSNESSSFGVVNKLSTLNIPVFNSQNIQNISSSEYRISWTGDEHADYYVLHITNPNGVTNEEKVYFQTTTNISKYMTVEGEYTVSIKSMVEANSENSKTYEDSRFSEAQGFTYSYETLKDFKRYSVYMNGEYYDFDIESTQDVSGVKDLAGLLWHYYLYGVDVNYKLPIHLSLIEEDEGDVSKAIIRLANQLVSEGWHDFSTDDKYAALSGNSNRFGYIVKIILGLYPELNILEDNFTCEMEGNIARLYFENKLDGEKTVTDSNLKMMKTDYSVDYKYLDIYSRRNKNTSFDIDSLPSMDVTTTEQLLQVVQFGKKPNFVGNSTVAQNVYNNARSVLINIVNNRMTDVEKATAIFDWLEYILQYNYLAEYKIESMNHTYADISTWGDREQFYLEGLFNYVSVDNVGNVSVEKVPATSELYSKAFTLLCGIEGITTRKLNGTFDDEGTTRNHSWNKILISDKWYVVDATMSDNNIKSLDVNNIGRNYEMASHAYFMSTDNFHNPENASGEKKYTISKALSVLDSTIGCNEDYDYYNNSSFGLTRQQVEHVVGAEVYNSAVDFKHGQKFDITVDYQQLTNKDAGLNKFEAFVFNKILELKYLQMTNSNNHARVEFSFGHIDELNNMEQISDTNINRLVYLINQCLPNNQKINTISKECFIYKVDPKATVPDEGDYTVYVFSI